jgi:hypothetical protein
MALAGISPVTVIMCNSFVLQEFNRLRKRLRKRPRQRLRKRLRRREEKGLIVFIVVDSELLYQNTKNYELFKTIL